MREVRKGGDGVDKEVGVGLWESQMSDVKSVFRNIFRGEEHDRW